MRLPRFRFTVRAMMVAVAIVGACSWGERIRRASSTYQERAELYRYILTTPIQTGHSAAVEQGIDMATENARGRRLIRYCEAMQLKYERAARYPWLPVAPDPPEPE